MNITTILFYTVYLKTIKVSCNSKTKEVNKMSEMNKTRTHKFVDTHPYLAACLFGVILWLVAGFLSAGINFLIHLVIADYPVTTGPVGTVLGSIAALLFYQFWFRPEFEGHMKGGDIAEGFRAAVPYLIYLAVSFVIDLFFVPEISFKLISLNLLFTAIAAGFIEETIFRGGLLTTMLRKMNNPNRILTAAVISAAVFGVIHMTNIVSGAGVMITVMQSINAFTTGLADALIYMVSGNIFVTIAIHTLHDILAFSFDTVTDSGLMTSTITWETWLNFALCTALGVYSIYMMRKESIQKHIMNVWNKKWNVTDKD